MSKIAKRFLSIGTDWRRNDWTARLKPGIWNRAVDGVKMADPPLLPV